MVSFILPVFISQIMFSSTDECIEPNNFIYIFLFN